MRTLSVALKKKQTPFALVLGSDHPTTHLITGPAAHVKAERTSTWGNPATEHPPKLRICHKSRCRSHSGYVPDRYVGEVFQNSTKEDPGEE